MTTNTVIRARIDAHLKEEASTVLAAIGLTLSDAFRMMLTKIVQEKALPFNPLIPNTKTIKAMKAARKGELVAVGKINHLINDLHADD